MPNINFEIGSVTPSALIELFELDLTPFGADILRFHCGTNEYNGSIVWDGEEYLPYPVQASGFEISGSGQIPRPTLAVANIAGAISAVILSYDDLLGAKVTRKRTLARYLDAVNFNGHYNPDADPDQSLPDDVYFIDRKSSENKVAVTFELSAAFDVIGVQLPRRQIVANSCGFAYRGTECGYIGAPKFDINDNPITSASSAEGQAVIDAGVIFTAANDALIAANAALALASNEKATQCGYLFVAEHYSTTIGHEYYVRIPSGVNTIGFNDDPIYLFDGAPVTLGDTYRQGRLQVAGGVFLDSFYYIEEWALDAGACSTASSAYTAALAVRDAAQTDYDDALSDYNAAYAALPSDDPLRTIDRCPKRLNSCKLRFGAGNPLSLGAFPAASILRG